MLEILEIKTPEEQNISVTYGDRTILYEIKWNDVHNVWYFNIKENDEYIATGITMSLNCNLLYDKFGLGKLYLIDTMQGETTDPIVKSDLGTRLALAREW